ncbi:hypothetical protein [Candidatus Laterigemmans baculatus]|uniref:hypothetical protein n=1 Tax=Candidatus Laterigemmans baculatus TaxID=2770505 RepID=UPI0013DCA1CE|nr:hypothetical protein [Candidatus Laterigemmans baculatus]
MVQWDSSGERWEFTVGGIDYAVHQNPIFDTSLIAKLPLVSEWLTDLDSQIDEEIRRNLKGWCEWTGEKDLVAIDLSGLIERSEIDVSYAYDDWGDLGINVVIQDGKITGSYAGD